MSPLLTGLRRKTVSDCELPEIGNFHFMLGQNDNAGRIMQENVQLNRTLYGETSLPYVVETAAAIHSGVWGGG